MAHESKLTYKLSLALLLNSYNNKYKLVQV